MIRISVPFDSKDFRAYEIEFGADAAMLTRKNTYQAAVEAAEVFRRTVW
jgi:hypothetical protein